MVQPRGVVPEQPKEPIQDLEKFNSGFISLDDVKDDDSFWLGKIFVFIKLPK